MKKFLFLLLTTVALGSMSVKAQNSGTSLKGDVNGDGVVDVADINAIIAIMKNGGGTEVSDTIAEPPINPIDSYSQIKIGGVTNSINPDTCFLFMFNKGTMNITNLPGAYCYDGKPFFYSKPEENVSIFGGSDNSKPFWRPVDDMSCYYPSTGAYDFWAYSAANATVGSYSVEMDKASVPMKITGVDDVLLAKAEPTEEDYSLVPDADRIYSAYSTRRGVQPFLNFKSVMSKLQFCIIPNTESVCDESSGIQITKIEVRSYKKGNLVFAALDKNALGFSIDKSSEKDSTTINSVIDLRGSSVGTPIYVDETMFLIPDVNYRITITMKQPMPMAFGTNEKKDVVMEIPIIISLGEQRSFEAEKSYIISIRVSGLQEMIVNSQLEGWGK